MKNILILSKSDGIRTQMVKGFLQHFARQRANVFSAGLRPGKIHPLAIKVMAESGIDISNQTSTKLKEFDTQDYDVIATVCNEVKNECPYLYSTALKIHTPLMDLSNIKGSEEAKLELFRQVREDARVFAHKFSKVHFKYIRK